MKKSGADEKERKQEIKKERIAIETKLTLYW